jgi:hypothetical protein
MAFHNFPGSTLAPGAGVLVFGINFSSEADVSPIVIMANPLDPGGAMQTFNQSKMRHFFNTVSHAVNVVNVGSVVSRYNLEGGSLEALYWPRFLTMAKESALTISCRYTDGAYHGPSYVTVDSIIAVPPPENVQIITIYQTQELTPNLETLYSAGIICKATADVACGIQIGQLADPSF